MTHPDIIRLLPHAFRQSDLPLYNPQRGKVRDRYTLPNGQYLFITTDRLSAFDRVLGALPYKGQVLNQLAAWWFEKTADILPNHVLSMPDPNALIAQSVEPFPVEVIVRGYITGITSTALWRRYELGEREIYGYRFPEGLRKNQALPTPIITPTTKGGPTGHDERLTCAEVVEKGYLDAPTWEKIQQAALAIFQRGQQIAAQAGLLLVDTKYEFGRTTDGQILLIDEVHTPDSSRFWKASSYPERFANSQEPELYDKEFIRLAYVERGYRGEGDPPSLPPEVWDAAAQLYISIYEMLTGETFHPGAYPVETRLYDSLQKAGILP